MSNSLAAGNQNQGDGEAAVPVQVIIDTGPTYRELVRSIEDRRKEVPKLLNSAAARRSCSIFRVPQYIKKINPKAFEPEIVSIGPYYHGEEYLLMIEEHKWRILDVVLNRLQAFSVGIHDFYKAIAPKETEIRACYSENIDKYDSRQLIEMMILDGCFIVELLCVVEHIINPARDDPIFKVPWISPSLTRDLLKLENQIPFFVLQTLYKLLNPDSTRVPSLQELIVGLCDYSMPRAVGVSELRKRYKNNDGEHLLDFYRSTFISASSKEKKMDRRYKFKLILSVEKLREAGIEFEERKSTDSFLDINFRNNGVLEIPRLDLSDVISSFLLNCIAFEQSYKHRSMHFTSYVVFMGSLIKTPLDAGHLRDKKIIENFFGTDEEVVKFFNEVGRDIFFDIEKTYLRKVFKDVNKYYGNKCHVALAEFKYNYFRTPWTCISAAVAFLLVILTIFQAVFSALKYFKPSN